MEPNIENQGGSKEGMGRYILGATVILIVGLGGYFMLSSKTAEAPENAGVASEVPGNIESGADSAWQTYRSSYGFEIQYPPVWKIVSEAGDGKAGSPGRVVSFGTGTFGNQGYDGELFVFAYDKSSTNVEQYIKDMGKQFSDRQEKRENITINGVSAVKAIVTTPSVPTWDYEAVIVEQQNRFYVMHNGAVKRDSFTDFYKSFKTDSLPTQQIAQTQIVSGTLYFHYTPYKDDGYSSQTTFIPRDEAPRVNNPNSQNMIKFRNYQNLLAQVDLEPPNYPGTCGWKIDATVEVANRKWQSVSSNVSAVDLVRFVSKDSQQVTCIP